MNSLTQKTHSSRGKRSVSRGRQITALLAGLCLLAGMALAATPPAGSVIGNQATASYVDSGGVTRTVTSNLVETIVQQVAGVTVDPDAQTKMAGPGTTVYFPHTITNNGNGTDSFNLTKSATDTNGILVSYLIYADANLDGIPDNLTPITATPSLAAGTKYGVVVAATITSPATATNTAAITLTATSAFTGAVTDSSIDTVTVSNQAVINLTKAISIGAGPSPNGDSGQTNPQITVTLSYTNAGLVQASAFQLRDILPAGMTYKAGTAKWKGQALTDAVGGDPAGIDFSYTSASDTLTSTIATVDAGTSGTLTFDVTIDSGLPSQTLSNRSDFQYNDGSAIQGTGYGLHTNTATYTVTSSYGVIFSDKIDTTTSSTDGDGVNDKVTVLTADAGTTVLYDNLLKNSGSSTDTFNITFNEASSTFPAGTTFILYQAGGAARLTDSNADGIADTGPVEPGAIIHVVLKAILPVGITPGGPYSIILTAVSVQSTTATDTVTDSLGTSSSSAQVDLTNDSSQAINPAYIGEGVFTETDPVVAALDAKAGGSVDFILHVENKGSFSDAYNFSYTYEGGFTPTGWRVAFIDKISGQEVSNTGPIAAGATKDFYARVTLPSGTNANLGAASRVLRFTVTSPSTTKTDTIRDSLKAVKDLAVSPENVGQVTADGFIVYTHWLLNLATTTETSAPITTSDSLAGSNWSSKVYVDTNSNGTFDLGTDTEIDNLNDIAGGLAANDKIQLFVRISAPITAVVNDRNVTTLAVALTGDLNTANNTIQDATTVAQPSLLPLEKRQALDANCDGTIEGSLTTSQIQAPPGACLRYQVTATNPTNLTSTPVTAVVIEDSTPPFTTYYTCGGSCAANAAGGTTAGTLVITGSNGTPAQFKVTVPSLAAGATCVLTFNLKIDQ